MSEEKSYITVANGTWSFKIATKAVVILISFLVSLFMMWAAAVTNLSVAALNTDDLSAYATHEEVVSAKLEIIGSIRELERHLTTELLKE